MYLHEQIIDEMLHLQARINPPMSQTEMVAEMALAMHLMLTFTQVTLAKMIIEKKLADADQPATENAPCAA